MDIIFYAALMGFIMASPFGVVGAACALAAMQHRLRDALSLATGVLLADALVIGTINFGIRFLPALTWEEVRSWGWLWWPMIGLLLGYAVFLLSGRLNPKLANGVIYPKRPFLQGIGWTLFANPKNWLGTFAAYAGWQVAGLLENASTQTMIAFSAWLGGSIAWLVWIAICWQATTWRYQAEQFAQRLVGILCLLAAVTAAFTLLQ